ncbi:Manf [Symbiodinium sp. KB8]|nr:Manf [Symbiodinium sp. KB8]
MKVQLLAATLCLFAVLASFAEAKRSDPLDCEVCKKVLGEVKENLDNTKDPKAIEAAIDDYCHSKKLHDKEKKLCYYLTPIKREVSGPMKFGVPTEKICQKLKKKSPEICELRYPVKIDTSSVDLNTLSLKQLRQILADRGVSCVGCLEKSDFVRKVEETNEQEL